MNRVTFHTLGCKVNQYETEAMIELFKNKGYKIVNEEDFADIYVINTCTVTNMSDRKSRQFIRKAKKINPECLVAVVGCYSQVSPEEVENIEGVDVIIGTNNRNMIVELCEESKITGEKINKVIKSNQLKSFEEIKINTIESKTRAYLKVQDGCNQYCSYCIIPYARGPVKSREYNEVEKEVKKLAENGFKEIILTGIHIASYGKDLGDIDLKKLIYNLSFIDGIKRIRLSSVEPNIIDEEFMKISYNTNKVCDHFHLSLQSGSDTVLSRMNRKYSTKEYYDKVELIRKYFPNAGITTDVIVGFPGETDEEFKQTLDFVKKVGFSKIHVFKFSPRKGTKAYSMEGQIPSNVKEERSKILIELSDNMMSDFHKKLIGKKADVLFESKYKEDFYEGYTTNYVRVIKKSETDLVGQIERVTLKEISDDKMLAI
ncbi:MAG TPA: tRNA (N(6)-L-threonylcarbamoyladenosine(37)-C(2))-methylthiotransferase MtaB [Soehngenia sp.]|nr:tRNA (N(6)-L-threonylcarbamoyladenosine(37)-C(2))-methylthiotransferase MtaB [Soehngenia sp.]HPP31223.1 tRNA (N(6)-L-threonylcarbamoyladenosine(37)-C(2))-methylthiotransferase MtaB [Soehngenia sp.]